jgi:hypothetical protein
MTLPRKRKALSGVSFGAMDGGKPRASTTLRPGIG